MPGLQPAMLAVVAMPGTVQTSQLREIASQLSEVAEDILMFSAPLAASLTPSGTGCNALAWIGSVESHCPSGREMSVQVFME